MKQCIKCDSVQSQKYKPFCSKRCADLDLYRWSTGSYAIPSDEQPTLQTMEQQDEY